MAWERKKHETVPKWETENVVAEENELGAAVRDYTSALLSTDAPSSPAGRLTALESGKEKP